MQKYSLQRRKFCHFVSKMTRSHYTGSNCLSFDAEINKMNVAEVANLHILLDIYLVFYLVANFINCFLFVYLMGVCVYLSEFFGKTDVFFLTKLSPFVNLLYIIYQETKLLSENFRQLNFLRLR